jgi:predicted transposase YbfD/YdcC
MHHSTDTLWTLVLPENGFAFEIGSLYDRLEALGDARKARGKRYSLALLLTLIILAKLCGEDRPKGIAEWARYRSAELIELLPLERETLPCANTYRHAVSRAVEPAALQQTLSEFLQAQPQAGLSVLVCIDGKTLRGTLSPSHLSGVHLLAAYLPGEGLVLLQLEVDCKTNEITVAPRLLQSLDLRGKIVMGDALHTSSCAASPSARAHAQRAAQDMRAISVQIVAAGGEYIWYAKDNQPSLCRDIAQTFPAEVCGPGSSPVPTDFQSATNTDSGHGRIEKRTLTTSSLLRGYLDWPGVQQVFKLERQVWDLQLKPLRSEVVYGLTSLSASEADAARLLGLIRDYWGIENGLHYRRDVTLHEDATRMRSARAAQVWTSLNNLLVGLLAPLGFSQLPEARRFFAARPASAVAVLTRHTL